MTTPEKFLVIGAGPVGLGMTRALRGHGIAYDQVDASDGIGGNWHHGVYDSAHLISSRRSTQFPEFPMPASYPDFPSRQQVLEYLHAYADKFGLTADVQLQRTVTHVESLPSDLWRVSFADGTTCDYRGVVVCNGHHWDRRWPNYPGTLGVDFIHSKDYKSADQLRGKRVLVIGGGNSACDIVSEAARVGASAHLSLRRGYWFLPKVLFGRPISDLTARHYTPLWLQRKYLRFALKVAVGKYARYGLPDPDHEIFDHHPTISSELFHYLKHGHIKVRPDIKKFDGDNVEFTDGTRDAFDIVVAATGFHVSFPFLAPGLVSVKGPVVEVYGTMMTAAHRHLYIVGWAQPRYGFGPLVKMAAESLVKIIETQDRMRNPVGFVLKRLGQKPPRTHLYDPNRIRLEIQFVQRLLPILPFLDRWIEPVPA
jgi:cation diffusion facilitator CzcD-associated flavoprotein CzcO